MSPSYIQLNHISKYINHQAVLRHIDLSIKKGTTHVLLGANGAGKSTLIHILCGISPFDDGNLIINGTIYSSCAPSPTASSLIAVSPQCNCITEELTVFQNLFMQTSIWFQNTERYFDSHIPDYLQGFAGFLRPYLHEKARILTPSQTQILQLVKTVLSNRDILIFDEPVLFLSDSEKNMFKQLIRSLKDLGKTILLISHAAEWCLDFADYITILKDGAIVSTSALSDCNTVDVLNTLSDSLHLKAYPKLPVAFGDKLLQVEFLSDDYVKDICFTLRHGEILGITGTLASGKSQIARLLVGSSDKQYGRLLYQNKLLHIHSPSDAISHGIYYLPQNRDRCGLFFNQDIRFNIVDVNTNIGLPSQQKAVALSRYYQRRLRIKASDCYDKVSSLSNGNRQKVMLGRAFCNQPQIFILDEPSAEIDAAGKSELYNIMNHLVLSGAAIILISSDFSEIAALCDRALFLHKGHCIETLEKEKLSVDTLYHLSSICTS